MQNLQDEGEASGGTRGGNIMNASSILKCGAIIFMAAAVFFLGVRLWQVLQIPYALWGTPLPYPEGFLIFVSLIKESVVLAAIGCGMWVMAKRRKNMAREGDIEK